jgi:hypothetical protein
MRIAIVIFVWLALTLLLAACRREEKAGTTTVTSAPAGVDPNERDKSGAPPNPQDEMRNHAIVRDLRARLANDEQLSPMAKDIRISLANGVMTVSGTVPSETDKQRILLFARSYDGVERVEDGIAVAPQ